MALQATIKNRMVCQGVGVHTGMSVHGHPASGARGHRHRLPPHRSSLASRRRSRRAATAWPTPRSCTTIGNRVGVTVDTIEHLMAALVGCGVDNPLVEIDGAEVPIMDGSAGAVRVPHRMRRRRRAGRAAARRPRAAKPVARRGRRRAAPTLLPGAGFSLELRDRLRLPRRSPASAHPFDLDDASPSRRACRARTFGFRHEVERLRAAGLARGGSLDNADRPRR